MTIHFGIAFDDIVFNPEKNNENVTFVGSKGFLNLLETWLGLSGDADENEYLRVERYRQAILKHLESTSDVFYKKSFEADAFSTSNFLLQRRDELKLAQWDFLTDKKTPQRLQILADLESILQSLGGLERGFADRFVDMFKRLDSSNVLQNLDLKIILHDELEDFPFYWQNVLHFFTFEKNNIENNFSQHTDLEAFKQKLTSQPALVSKAKVDGSLLIIKGKRETDLAVFLAKLMKKTPDFEPLCLIPETNQLLDSAMQQEGLPRMGIASAAARPVQQLLKLVAVFLWRPIDPFRIMEFLTMGIKPLDDRLARELARVLSEKPGLMSDSWNFTLKIFEKDFRERHGEAKNNELQEIIKQYKFWFEREKYKITNRVPKKDAILIYEYLENWAHRTFSDNPKFKSLLTLSEQARKIKELFLELPEISLSKLELERIVRTIYRPTPVTVYEREQSANDYIHRPGAMAGESEDTLWWNFTDHSPQQILNVWKKEELTFFEEKKVQIEGNEKKNRIYWSHQKRPILRSEKRLVLVVPSLTNGQETIEHPLMGYLHSVMPNHAEITINIDKNTEKSLEKWFFPSKKSIELAVLPKSAPFIEVDNIYRKTRENESPTSLEDLIYYPHKWAFKYQTKINSSSILSISKDKRLMGNLAHRFFEEIFKKEKIADWTKSNLEIWLKEKSPSLMEKEGAVLLMYGKEQEREHFLSTFQYAAWNLISMINNNGWSVLGSEENLEGNFGEKLIKGKADLILQREDEMAIIDMKWSGLTHRKDLIRNQEDLQLVMYSHLLGDKWAHTAYFIIESGQMLVRNTHAFKEGTVVPKQEENHVEINKMIFERMMKTYEWRMEQLESGKIEIRTQDTVPALEEIYAETMLDLLEMKKNDSRFDDYRVLINAVS
jgi:ATP-dependent helicase/nuclease subunit B